MFKPKYATFIDKKSFHPDEVICLGSQLAKIVTFLIKILPPHIWYIADVDIYNQVPDQFKLNSFLLEKIGDDLMLIKLLSKIDQFLSGVFLAINSNAVNQKLENIEIATDDLSFRDLSINGVLLEIRTVDTSFFAIYSDSNDIIVKLTNHFNSLIKSKS